MSGSGPDRAFKLDAHPPSADAGLASISVPMEELRLASALEFSVRAEDFLHLPFIYEAMLRPPIGPTPAWVWRGEGAGKGREVRRALSNLFARCLVRWYAWRRLGIFDCVPLDSVGGVIGFRQHPHRRFRVEKRPRTTGDLPDWVYAQAALPGAHLHQPAGFLESKGRYGRYDLLRTMDAAKGQIRCVRLVRVNGLASETPCSTQGWVVGVGWGCERPSNGRMGGERASRARSRGGRRPAR
jgi:hypothetical protein